MLPLNGITVVVGRAGGRGAVRDAAARRPRRAGDQDRAARRRRLRARLRHDGQRPLELFRLAEPIEGIADARSEAAGGRRRARSPARARRRLRPEPRAGRGRSAGHVGGGAARTASAADRLQRVRLRRRRPLFAEESVRPAGAERGRAGFDHRHRSRAGKGGHLGRRHRRRHVCLLGHPHGALRARRRPDAAHRSTSRCSTRSTEWMAQPALFAAYGGTPPPRAGANHASIAPYGPFRAGDGGADHLGIQNAREWAAFCADVLRQPGARDDERFAHQPAARAQSSGAARRDRVGVCPAVDGRGHRAARVGRASPGRG